jgi:hypothetical protein
LWKVDAFRYMGRIMAQDDDDICAVLRSQIKKARGILARINQILCAENTPPKVSAKFYKSVVQSLLLYGSETWNLTKAALARLEGFLIGAAYRMAAVHKPRRDMNLAWVYLCSQDVLKECGMGSIAHYIGVRRETIMKYVVNRQIYKTCRAGVWGRGSAPRQWWWEQPMSFTDSDAGVGER